MNCFWPHTQPPVTPHLLFSLDRMKFGKLCWPPIKRKAKRREGRDALSLPTKFSLPAWASWSQPHTPVSWTATAFSPPDSVQFLSLCVFFPTSKNHTCIVTAPLSSNTTVLCQPTWSLWKQFRVRSLCGEPIPDQTGDLHYDTISQWPHRERI